MADLVQTHKTIIFEEFDTSNPNSLYTILSNNPSDDELSRGIKKLTVSSFNEFMEKFAPKIYESCAKDPATGEIMFHYTTNPKDFGNYPYSEVPIKDHIYYKMLSRLYAAKGMSGKSSIEFDDKEILEMLTPKKEIESVLDTRKKLEYNLQNYYLAQANGDRSAMNEAGQKVKDCRKKIAEYAQSTLNTVLPILIEDTNTKLKLLEMSSANSGNNGTKSLDAPKFGVLYLNAEGKLDIDETKQAPAAAKQIAAPKDEKGGALIQVKDNLPAEVKEIPAQKSNQIPDKETLANKIAATIAKDYDAKVKIPSETIKSLIVAAFAPTAYNPETSAKILDKDSLLASRQMFEQAYANARTSFMDKMSAIVENLFGVKVFFDHATPEGGEEAEIPGGVIVSNCKASKMLDIKETFAKYMKNSFGKAQTDKRVWFAVVPHVLEGAPIKNSAPEDIDILDGDFEDENNSTQNDESYVSINALKEFLDVMENAKIMTVFNIRKSGNTFSDLSSAEVTEKMQEFQTCRYGHAVYAYPDFTLISEKDFPPFEESNIQIAIPKIFVDAAYPAAGLLVASQQFKVLDNRKLRYDKGEPCVGIDFENATVKKALATKFNRESILRRSEDLIKIINENMFGFVFSGDDVKDKSGTWKNSYVHCARTLAKNEKTGLYKPVYQTLVEDYIALDLLQLVSKKKADVKKEIKRINNIWEEKNNMEHSKNIPIVNFLLREGENIEIDTEDDKVKVRIHFNGGDGYVDVDVESD